ncbi:unnamed protein product [Brachionus calyciflorus]|uniref:Schwannomin interacting protein 1 C-terminal domain-containing protein n=1 Tax=Brachionus calyciflorus TaxID=104777 RepID=A0A813RBE8_9BILA|nr:unnamed protein product [Brachionus calyciflorus]
MSLYYYYINNKYIDLNYDLGLFVQEISLKNKRASIHNDREEIRRKLAMVSSSSSSSSFTEQNQDNLISDYLRRPSATKNNLIGQNLQICFMNELADDLIDETLPEPLDQVENETSNNMVNSTSSFSLQSINSNDSCDTILSQLQNETKQALAKVPNEVRFKMQSELVNKKPSPIADIVGLPTYGLKRLERENIVDMNIGQLQVIVNDLCNQIEKINEDLKVLLIDRDDLYMQQDSILVDIEDITKRIKEYAQKCKNSKENGDLISGTTHQKTCPSNGISAKLKSFVCNNHQQAAIMNTSDTTNSISSQKSKLFHLGKQKKKLFETSGGNEQKKLKSTQNTQIPTNNTTTSPILLTNPILVVLTNQLEAKNPSDKVNLPFKNLIYKPNSVKNSPNVTVNAVAIVQTNASTNPTTLTSSTTIAQLCANINPAKNQSQQLHQLISQLIPQTMRLLEIYKNLPTTHLLSNSTTNCSNNSLSA